jgi:hypothetical protein
MLILDMVSRLGMTLLTTLVSKADRHDVVTAAELSELK